MLLKTAKKIAMPFFLSGMLLALTVGCDTSTADLYRPGVYTDSAEGFHGPVTVSVTFSTDRITAVTVDSHTESVDPDVVPDNIKEDVEEVAPFVRQAIVEIPQAIVEKQSPQVDVVSGATTTSRAIKQAVVKCIGQASN